MVPDPEPVADPADDTTRHCPTWRAACVNRTCRVRHVGTESSDRSAVLRWVTEHTGGRGGHVVALWVVVGGHRQERPVMLRYGARGDDTTDWILWGWVCLTRHAGEHRPRWNEGHLSADDALTAWWGHKCEGSSR